MKRFLCILTAVILSVAMLASCGQDANPEWREQLKLGKHYLKERDYENAIAAFNKAIEIDPDRAEAYVERAQIYVQRDNEGDLALAGVDYEKAIELGEENTEVFLDLAALYERLGYIDWALETLRQGCDTTGSPKLTERLEELEHFACPKAGSPGTEWHILRNGNCEVTQKDELGRAIAVAEYNDNDSSVLRNQVYTYAENGYLLKHETLYFQSGKAETITYSGNSKRQILCHEYSNKESRIVENYTYNGANVTMMIVLEDAGYSPLRINYLYSMEAEDHKAEFGSIKMLLGQHVEFFDILEFDAGNNLVKQTRMEYNGVFYEEVQK